MYTPPRLVRRGLKVTIVLDSNTVKLLATVTSSDETTPTHDIVGGVISGIGGVAVQRREREEPATESPDTLMVTTGGRGAVGGVMQCMYTLM